VQNLPRYLVLDDGRLIVAHAGLPEEYHGSTSAAALDFAVNGRKNAHPEEHGGETRYRWAEDYRGEPFVVFGHYAQPEVSRLNGTLCLDTGCVYGGRLSALRYPEHEIVSVPAAKAYKESKRWRQTRAGVLTTV
jgi:protein phosphatase